MMSTGAASGNMARGNWCFKTTSFLLHAIKGRWFMVFGAVIIMSMSGPTFMFAAYSGAVKSTLGYTQTTLNMISFFKDVGTTVGVPSGLMMEVAPPWLVLATGAGINFFGHFMIWLAVTRRIAKPPVWQMCLYTALGANFLAFTNTGVLVPCVRNFPEERGVVLGVLKGFVGLSSAIITQLYHAIFDQNPKALILFIAILPTIITLVFVRTIRISKGAFSGSQNDVKFFYQLLYMSLGLAGFIFIMIILQVRISFSQNAYIGSAIAVTLLLCLPLYIVFKQELYLWKAKQYQQEPTIENDCCSRINVVSDESTSDIQPTRKVDLWYENVFRPPNRGEDHTILQALFSIDMIILFIVTVFGMGGNLTAIDNLGQIGSSLGYSPKRTTTFVSLVSIWSYLGRVSVGYVSEYLLKKYKAPRPLMVTCITLLSCVGHVLIAYGVHNGLYMASVIIGFCYGAYWPLTMAITSEIFGLKYYSTLINVGPLASPLGMYMFNVKVTGGLYDREALRQLAALGLTRKEGEELTCDGVKCFKPAFLIITAITSASVFVSLVLVVRTRMFYKSDIYKNFRKVEKTTVVEGIKGVDGLR